MGALESGHKVYQTDGSTGLYTSVPASCGGTSEAEIHLLFVTVFSRHHWKMRLRLQWEMMENMRKYQILWERCCCHSKNLGHI